MNASDFLDPNKQRLLRLKFPDFTMYGGFSGLLDVHISEIMNDSPDVTIGSLVVPELTITLDNAHGGTMASVLHQNVICEVGLEQRREDVTEMLLTIQRSHPGKKLCFVLRSNGESIYTSGTEIHSGTGVWYAASGITGLYLDETAAMLYLLHDTEPFCTCFPVNADGLTGTEQSVKPVSALHEAVLRDLSRYRTGLTETADGAIMTEIKESVYYRDGVMQYDIISGAAITFECVEYDTFELTDTTIQDDETMEAVGYGLLGKLAGIPAEEFFTDAYITVGETLAQVFERFLGWLAGKGVVLKSGMQKYLMLDKLIVIPDWFNKVGTYKNITAAQLLQDFAVYEAGNAYLNKERELVLGWCSEEPVVTITAGETAYMRIGTDMLTGAEGFRYRGLKKQNSVWTEAEMYATQNLLDVSQHKPAFDGIFERFADVQILPFAADILVGTSPLLRVGDCIRIVTKNGAAVTVPVLMQDVDGFPFLTSRMEAPEGTTWRTVPVDLLPLTVIAIETDGWQDHIFEGETPDFSGLIVTAIQRNGERFTAHPGSYRLTYREDGDDILAEVSYAGITASKRIPVTVPLRTKDGGLFYTLKGAVLSVKRRKYE